MRVYGPVPSRRFGLSLGIDIVPHKACPFDCIYCQLGHTDILTDELNAFFDVNEIIRDAKAALSEGPKPDVITLAGSGDPTLYKSLKELIVQLKELSDVPVLLITNGALLWKKEVAEAALLADILAPSLDFGTVEIMNKINKPHPDITFEKIIQGLRDVTHAHKGEIRLEVMLIRDINDDEDNMNAIAEITKTLRFDRLDLNTPVRPPVPERCALPCDETVLERAKEIFGPKAHPIGSFEKKRDTKSSKGRSFDDFDKDIRETIMRRPCTVDDLCASLGMDKPHVSEALQRLIHSGIVTTRTVEDRTYYQVPGSNPTVRPNL